MFEFILKLFIQLSNFSGSLAGMVTVCSLTICIYLNNQPCTDRLTLIDLSLEEHFQVLRYYLFMVNLDRRNGSCNNLQDPSDKICASNKTEDVNLSILNMIARISESKILKSCKCKCKFVRRKL